MIKKLAKSIREYKKPAILTPICMVMEVFMEIAIPYLLATLIDQGIEQSNGSEEHTSELQSQR